MLKPTVVLILKINVIIPVFGTLMHIFYRQECLVRCNTKLRLMLNMIETSKLQVKHE